MKIIKGKELVEVKKETLKEQAQNFIKRIGKCKTNSQITEETMHYIFVMTEVTTVSQYEEKEKENGKKEGEK